MSSSSARDSLCSVVSDSEIRRWDDASMMDLSGGRPLVSKDANWILSSQQLGSPAPLGSTSLNSSLAAKNPVERAEKLLAVLKTRLFSAQLNSFKNAVRNSNQLHRSDIRRSLALQVHFFIKITSSNHTVTIQKKKSFFFF